MLSEARSNETVRVVKCHGGRGFKENLARLGVLPGVLLQVIAKGRSGPVIISCRGCRIAIGQGMAERIEVIRENAAT
ncbi:MAG TPA: FeoA family protein [Candidatus Hydrogenedentes bacterium]|nr:FeoA family protein [Candidatus Hydrogenedentota bacterium]